LALWPGDAREERVSLLRLLGTALYEAGELQQAEAVLAEGTEAAGAAGLPAVQARIRIRLVETRALLHGSPEEKGLAECEAATAILEAEGDLEGLAAAWLLTGMTRFWLGKSHADQQALERAIVCAQKTGHRRVQIQASSWLAWAFCLLPIPADTAVARTGQLLQAANGEPWAEADILIPLSLIYSYAGRLADARDAIARVQSVYNRSGAKVRWAMGEFTAGYAELIAGDLAAAERHLRKAYEALRAIGTGPQWPVPRRAGSPGRGDGTHLGNILGRTPGSDTHGQSGGKPACRGARQGGGRSARSAAHLSRSPRRAAGGSGHGRPCQPHRPSQRQPGLNNSSDTSRGCPESATDGQVRRGVKQPLSRSGYWPIRRLHARLPPDGEPTLR
jgi:tetratricopeptide (TPR) repeat protein